MAAEITTTPTTSSNNQAFDFSELGKAITKIYNDPRYKTSEPVKQEEYRGKLYDKWLLPFFQKNGQNLDAPPKRDEFVKGHYTSPDSFKMFLEDMGTMLGGSGIPGRVPSPDQAKQIETANKRESVRKDLFVAEATKSVIKAADNITEMGFNGLKYAAVAEKNDFKDKVFTAMSYDVEKDAVHNMMNKWRDNYTSSYDHSAVQDATSKYLVGPAGEHFADMVMFPALYKMLPEAASLGEAGLDVIYAQNALKVATAEFGSHYLTEGGFKNSLKAGAETGLLDLPLSIVTKRTEQLFSKIASNIGKRGFEVLMPEAEKAAAEGSFKSPTTIVYDKQGKLVSVLHNQPQLTGKPVQYAYQNTIDAATAKELGITADKYNNLSKLVDDTGYGYLNGIDMMQYVFNLPNPKLLVTITPKTIGAQGTTIIQVPAEHLGSITKQDIEGALQKVISRVTIPNSVNSKGQYALKGVPTSDPTMDIKDGVAMAINSYAVAQFKKPYSALNDIQRKQVIREMQKLAIDSLSKATLNPELVQSSLYKKIEEGATISKEVIEKQKKLDELIKAQTGGDDVAKSNASAIDKATRKNIRANKTNPRETKTNPRAKQTNPRAKKEPKSLGAAGAGDTNVFEDSSKSGFVVSLPNESNIASLKAFGNHPTVQKAMSAVGEYIMMQGKDRVGYTPEQIEDITLRSELGKKLEASVQFADEISKDLEEMYRTGNKGKFVDIAEHPSYGVVGAASLKHGEELDVYEAGEWKDIKEPFINLTYLVTHPNILAGIWPKEEIGRVGTGLMMRALQRAVVSDRGLAITSTRQSRTFYEAFGMKLKRAGNIQDFYLNKEEAKKLYQKMFLGMSLLAIGVETPKVKSLINISKDSSAMAGVE